MAIATDNDLRTWLEIPKDVTSNTAQITTAVTAACAAVISHCGRDFSTVATASTRIFDAGPSSVLIDDAAVVSVVETSADRVTWTTLSTTTWFATPHNTAPKTTVHTTAGLSRFARVTATWGFGAVPEPVKLATLIKAARLFKRKDSASGVEGFGDFGIIRVSSREDADVVALLAPYVRADRAFGLA